LVCNHLHFRHRFERRLEAFARCAIVIVVETVDRQVVRVSRRACK
jgi:hypothetical protein